MSPYRHLCLFAAVAAASVGHGLQPAWTRSFALPGRNSFGLAAAVDSAGIIHVVGVSEKESSTVRFVHLVFDKAGLLLRSRVVAVPGFLYAGKAGVAVAKDGSTWSAVAVYGSGSSATYVEHCSQNGQVLGTNLVNVPTYDPWRMPMVLSIDAEGKLILYYTGDTTHVTRFAADGEVEFDRQPFGPAQPALLSTGPDGNTYTLRYVWHGTQLEFLTDRVTLSGDIVWSRQLQCPLAVADDIFGVNVSAARGQVYLMGGAYEGDDYWTHMWSYDSKGNLIFERATDPSQPTTLVYSNPHAFVGEVGLAIMNSTPSVQRLSSTGKVVWQAFVPPCLYNYSVFSDANGNVWHHGGDSSAIPVATVYRVDGTLIGTYHWANNSSESAQVSPVATSPAGEVVFAGQLQLSRAIAVSKFDPIPGFRPRPGN